MIAHWDDLDGRLDGVAVAVSRLVAGPGGRASSGLGGEQIVFVVAGSGVSQQDGETSELRAGDCVVYFAGEEHTLSAGSEGLEAVVFGERSAAGAQHEARATTVVSLADVEGDFGGLVKPIGRAAGSVRAGLNWTSLPPGEEGAPPHCHSAEEELFVVLEGEGTLRLWPSPQATRLHPDAEVEDHPVRAGHVVSRPPGTRIAHSFHAGDAGLTYLAYGTREPNDIAYYPRSNKIFFRGVGLIARLENLDYSDGEPG